MKKIYFKNAIIVIIFNLFILSGLICWAEAAWLYGFSRKVPLTITGSASGGQTDYQVKIEITYDTDMQGDFDDIRFTAADGITLLDYWMEVFTSSVSAVFWVKIPFIPALPGTTTIYIYYGNYSGGSAANGDNTFEFFDDFSADLNKWTIMNGNWAISNGELIVTSGSNRLGLYATDKDFSDAVIEFKVIASTLGALHGQGGYYRGDGTVGDTDGWIRMYWVDGFDCWSLESNSTGIDSSSSLSPEGVRRKVRIVFIGTSHNVYIDDTLIMGGTSSIGTNPGKVGVYGWNQNSDQRWDDFRVRKYINPEPFVSATGNEEQRPSLQSPIVTITSSSGGTTMRISEKIIINGLAESGVNIYSVEVKDERGNILSEGITTQVSINALGEISGEIDLGGLGRYPLVNVIKVEAILEDGCNNKSGAGISNYVTIIAEGNKVVPYNNVFNPNKGERCEIKLEVVEDTHVSVKLYTLVGDLVKILVDEDKQAGTEIIYWYGKNDCGHVVASGTYLLRIEAGGFKDTKKICVIK